MKKLIIFRQEKEYILENLDFDSILDLENILPNKTYELSLSFLIGLISEKIGVEKSLLLVDKIKTPFLKDCSIEGIISNLLKRKEYKEAINMTDKISDIMKKDYVLLMMFKKLKNENINLDNEIVSKIKDPTLKKLASSLVSTLSVNGFGKSLHFSYEG